MGLENKIDLPDGHKLQEVDYRQEGMMGQDRFWDYDELDGSGIRVARYEYWECVSSTPPFKNSFGYRKRDLDGAQLEEVEF